MAKLAVLLPIVALFYCASAYSGKKWDQNAIKRLLEVAINKFAWEGKKHSPILVGKLPTQKISGTNYDISVDFSKVNIWMPDVDIKELNVKLTPKELKVQQQLLYRNEIVKGDMRVSGNIGGADVDENGTYEADWIFTHKTNMNLQYDADSVTIRCIDFDFQFALPKITLRGFSFERISVKELERRSSEGARDTLLKQLEDIKKWMPTAIRFLNRLLKGQNLDDILDLLNKLVNPTFYD